VTGGASASAGRSSVATGSLSPAGFFKSDTPEELRYEAEKLADNDQGATEAQEEPTLEAADVQKEPALDLNQSEKNEATADAHMVGSRRSTLLYGDRNEHETIEGRPVYESTIVSEALADVLRQQHRRGHGPSAAGYGRHCSGHSNACRCPYFCVAGSGRGVTRIEAQRRAQRDCF